jgi:hypothetical protein
LSAASPTPKCCAPVTPSEKRRTTNGGQSSLEEIDLEGGDGAVSAIRNKQASANLILAEVIGDSAK